MCFTDVFKHKSERNLKLCYSKTTGIIFKFVWEIWITDWYTALFFIPVKDVRTLILKFYVQYTGQYTIETLYKRPNALLENRIKMLIVAYHKESIKTTE
jgi:hypothetical protein